MGYGNYQTIKTITSKQLANGIKIYNCKHESVCDICIKFKTSEDPYPKSTEYKAAKRLELIHSDVFGPIQKLGGN